MKKAITYLFSLILIVSLALLYSFSAVKNSNKKIKKIEIEFSEGNNDFLTQKMVNKLLIQSGQELQNQPKSVIDLQELEKSVLFNPYIETATVFYTIDGVLKTEVKQRTPIARINTANSSYYIDKYGVKIPLSDNYSARVLLITGNINEENLQEFTPFVKVILADDFLKKEIIGIHKTQKNEFVLSVRSGQYKIEFGSLEKTKINSTRFKNIPPEKR